MIDPRDGGRGLAATCRAGILQASAIPTQPPAEAPGKAAENGSSAWALLHTGDPNRVPESRPPSGAGKGISKSLHPLVILPFKSIGDL